ncbi:sugar ABC transporter substrate-binding protein [candidate division KSB1 bacterium]|nr:sugar ABC transporter substrate-binding protein [candidate division KSB1 bacterium]
MKHLTHLPVLLLIILILSTSLTCTDEKSTGDKKVIRFMFWGGYRDFSLWRDLKREYEALYLDRTVKLELVSGLYQDKLSLALVAQSAADVFMVDDDYFKVTAASGHLENLEPFMEAHQDELKLDEFFPHALSSFQLGGAQYAIPLDGFPIVLFYNRELFDKDGVGYPEAFWTWQEVLESARKLTRDTDGDGYTDQFGICLGTSWLTIVPMIWTYGGDMLSVDLSRCTFNDPPAIEAMQFFRDLIFKYKVAPHGEELADMNDYIMLLTGKVGMILAGAYTVEHLRSIEDGMDWGITLMPSGPAGKFNRVSFDGIAIYSRSKVKQEAWDWIRLIMTETGQRMIGHEGRALPVRVGDAYRFYDRPDTRQDESIAIEAMLKYGRTMPNVALQSEIAIATRTHLESLKLPDTDVRQVAENLTRDIDKILVKMRDQYEIWK